MRCFDPADYAAHAGKAAVTEPFVTVSAEVLAHARAAPGVEEGGAVQVHDGIGVFKWIGAVSAHVDDIPPNQITMGLVLVNDGDFAMRTADSPDLLALPAGAVWRLDSHVLHEGVQQGQHPDPMFIGILWDADRDDEPQPAAFAAEALIELCRWREGSNPSRYEREKIAA